MALVSRRIETTLLRWKEKLKFFTIGARQTGKTFIINKICNTNYEQKVEINFLKNKVIAVIF